MLAKTAGTVRYCYNWGLAKWNEMYQNGEECSKYTLSKLWTTDRPEWAKEVSRGSQTQALMNLGAAFSAFFKKKAKHLEEEEMAEASGGPCAGNMVNEEESVRITDKEYELSEDFLCDEETLDDIPDMEQFSEETLDDIPDMVDFSEEIKGMLEDVNDMLEEIGLDELLDSPVSGKGDMDPADIKAMKIKHRNKEMKDIVKADAEYLKAVFEHLEQMKEEGTVSGNANATTQAVSSAIGMAGSVSEPVINIQI